MRIKRLWDPTPRRGPNEFLIESKQDPSERLGFVDPLKTHQREQRIDKIRASAKAQKAMRRAGRLRKQKKRSALTERAEKQKQERAKNITDFLALYEEARARQKANRR